jgi:hypothetical protein
MAKTKIKLNSSEIRKLLQGKSQYSGVREDLERRARAIAAAAGGSEAGFEVGTNVGPNRARASVVTTTAEAMRAEAEDRTLTRAIDAGRG